MNNKKVRLPTSRRNARFAGRRWRRTHGLEQLEKREMLAAAVWNNVVNPLNVDGDSGGFVSPIDVLVIVNELNGPKRSDPETGKLPKQVTDGSNNPFLDVSCDSFVTPVDALIVVNYLNSIHADDPPPVFHSGGGTYANVACSPQLLEGSGFAAELSRVLTLPDDSSAVQVKFDAPQFDMSSKRTIRDAFEIEITDLDGNPVALAYLPDRDAVYNWSEDFEPLFGPGSATTTLPAGQDSSVTINLSGLAAGTQVRVAARLVNNDADDNTSVIIRGYEVIDAPQASPAGSPGKAAPAEASAIDFASLKDISSSFVASYGRTTLAGDNSELVTDLMVTNRGSSPVTGTILVVVDNISEPDAHALHPDGFLLDGRPYFDLTPQRNGQPLEPGMSLTSREIRFLNQSGRRFGYRLRTLGKVNLAPSGFDSLPQDAIEALKTYRYAAHANDPENQPLVYTKLVGPESMSIDAASGQLSWETTSEDVGRHAVTLHATDPFGLFVEQSFVVEVFESLQNRPPVFVSTPETDAIAASGFEVTTLATGAGPIGVGLLDVGFKKNTLVTINPGTQTISQHESLPFDTYGPATELSIGEPRPRGDFLRSGYVVDLGLPRYVHPFETNRIDGFDQGDINGDGKLDLVSNVAFREELPTRTFTQQIVVNYGKGDSSFEAAVVVASLPSTTSSSIYNTLAVNDFTGDGFDDVLTLNDNTGTLYLLPSDGAGGLGAPRTQLPETKLFDFKVVDLDRDGTLDLLARAANNQQLGYLLGVGDGTFAEFVPVVSLPARHFLANSGHPGRSYDAGDLDGDGDLDLAVVENTDRDAIILLNDGDLNFVESGRLAVIRPGTASTRSTATTLEIAEFSGDAHADIFIGTELGNTIRTGGAILYLGDGSGSQFTYQVASNVGTRAPDNSAGSSDPIDIDADGDLDLVLGSSINSQTGYGATIMLNHGDGTFVANEISSPSADDSVYILTDTEAVVRGLVVGDYNSDGMLDLAFSRSNNSIQADFSAVVVTLADRPGKLATGASTAFAQSPNTSHEFFQAGDFNGDGYLDLWSPGYQTVSRTWLGRGDGTYDEPIIATPYIGNEGLRQGFVDDLDRDGNLDVVWLGGGGVQGGPKSRLIVALGNGDGTFSITHFGTGVGTLGVARAADFNGDGFLDIATRSHGPQIDIWIYDPSQRGTYIHNETFPLHGVGANVNGYYTALAVADFNGDGFADFTTVDRDSGSDPHKLMTYFGKGDGTFEEPVEEFDFFASASYTQPYFVDAGDLNEDGHVDIVTYEYYGLTVHLNHGDGSFDLPTHYPGMRTSRTHNGLHVVDFDQDGHLDILFTDSNGTEQIGFLRGRGDGAFDSRIGYDLGYSGSSLTLADFDNDLHLDVIAGTQSGAPIFTTLSGARAGLSDLTTLDINADGNDDLFAINTDNSRIKWYLGDDLGRLNRQADLLTDAGPVAVTSADLDGNGQSEIITVNRSGSSVSVFSGDIDTGFVRSDFDVGIGPIGAAVADATGDAILDLWVIDDNRNALWLMPGDGDLSFSDPLAVPLGDRPSDLFVADANGDSLSDAIISLPESNRIMILPGAGNGEFEAPTYVPLTAAPGAVVAHDFNDDGHLDLAVVLAETDEVAILFGRGASQYAPPQRIRVGDGPASIALGDADDDGRVDLLVANAGDHTASVIYNRFDPTEVFRYDARAIDPDDDTVAYALLDGPGGLILNGATGSIRWAPSPDQLGLQSVTLEASDGRGGKATQSFRIDVQPARNNAPPVIASTPTTQLAANQRFEYQLQSRDDDHDPLRYRIVDGPENATVDPTTGLLSWDGRRDAARLFDRAQYNKVVVPNSPSLELTDFTLEGWYHFHDDFTAQYLFRKANSKSSSYALYFWRGDLVVEIANDQETVQALIPFPIEIGRWYHLAGTFSATTGDLRLYVDGELVASTNTDISSAYSDTDLILGSTSNIYTPAATIDSVRVWNVARDDDQIREGLYGNYEGDPNLVLDFRFEPGEQTNVRDHSPAQNDGYLFGGVLPQTTGGLATAPPTSITVSVEDGRGGYDEQTFEVTYVPPLFGSIAGCVFEDGNDDGVQQPEEAGLEGWAVFVDFNGNGYRDASEPEAQTNADGDYLLGHLLPQAYPLRIEPRAGYITPSMVSVPVNANEQTDVVQAVAAGALGQIRGHLRTPGDTDLARWKVFADLDRDGSLDDGEPWSMTDSLGDFALLGLAAGDYQVRPQLLPGWNIAEPSAGSREVTLQQDAIAVGNDFTLAPATTTAASGLQFVTTPLRSLNEETIDAQATYLYHSLALGLQGEAVAYDVSLGPDGLSIDPVTGLVVWRPTLGQIGEHRVILRARDSRDGVALQDFSLRVAAPNAAPVIASTPPTIAYASIPMMYSILGQDAESRDLSYAILSGPAAANVDSASGQLTWTPSTSDVGQAAFEVSVTDAGGLTTTQAFVIDVAETAPSTTPLQISAPRPTAAVGQVYRSQLVATDALGRPISLSLDSGPDGFTLSAAGRIHWTPTAADLGSAQFTVTANDGLGNSQSFTLAVDVFQRLRNSPPRIVSQPVAYAVADRPYSYDVVVEDDEHDLLAFQLVEAPAGMSIDPNRGTIRWAPGRENVGEQTIIVRAIDAYGAVSEQGYNLRTRRAGGPPSITSTPPTEAAVGLAYLYSVVAADLEMDPLTYSLLDGPEGLTIDRVTGEIAWTPQPEQTGLQPIAIQVADGTGAATSQSFAIRVATGAANLPPTFASAAGRFATAAEPYNYQASAIDPENTEIAYSLRRAPSGMSVDAATGFVQWTPTAGDAGKHVVTIIATDADGGASVQSFELDVLAENSAPQFLSSPPTQVFAGETWNYDAVVRDTDLDPIRFELLSGPSGMSLDAFGQLRWPTSTNDIGDRVVTIRAIDPRRGSDEQMFTLSVVADSVPPRVVVNGTGFRLPWNGPLSFFVSASDNVGVASLVVTVDDQPFTLAGNGMGYLTFDEWGLGQHTVQAIAMDAAGNTSTATGIVAFCDPCGSGPSSVPGGGVENPLAQISSPGDAASVTGMVSIVGTAAIPDFSHYRLLYRRADVEEFTEFFRGTTAVNNGELAVWDTSLLENDEYELRLEVSDTSGRVAVDDVSVGLSGALKLGNFRLSFTDMVIPVAGIPIQITRTYDTLRADREGDFGFGWRLEYRETDLRVGLPKSGLEDIGIYTPMRPGVKVYLTLPGQERLGWTFTPEIRVLPGFGNDNLVLAAPRFTPDRGNTATLSAGGGQLFVNPFGELFAAGNQPWNPASPDFGGGYTVTTRDGMRYSVNGNTGKLDSIADRNGNALRFSESAITSSEGNSQVVFERDARGRIVSIADPAGNSVRYAYSSASDLISATDREGYSVRFEYLNQPPHYVSNVIDPLGRETTRYEYDAAGRVNRRIELDGQSISVLHDPANALQVTEDDLGRQVILQYNQQGQLVSATDALGNTTTRQYDDFGNVTQVVDPLGGTSTFSYGPLNQLVAQTNPNGATTRFEYDSSGNLIAEVDPLGGRVTYLRDARGNIVETIDALGGRQHTTVDARGRVTQTTDGIGRETTIGYTAIGLVERMTNPDGSVVESEYDVNGNRIGSTLRVDGNPAGVSTTQWVYDSNGLPRESIVDGAMVESRQYDANRNLTSTTNGSGDSISYQYDESSQRTAATYASGASVAAEYDAQGRLSGITDILGRATAAEYDALDRPTSQTILDRDGQPLMLQSYDYDAAGRVTQTTNSRMATESAQYDAAGNVVAISTSTDASPGGMESYLYDALGRPTQLIDASGGVTELRYDARSRLVELRLPTGQHIHRRYDLADRLVEIRDNTGLFESYAYNERDQLMRVTLSDGSSVRYEYDATGNHTATIDADGDATRFEYDASGRMTALRLPDGSSQSFEHNSFGLPIKWVDHDGREVTYAYDGRSQLVGKVLPDGSQFTYAYNSQGNVVQAAGPAGSVSYAYDDSGRLLNRTESDGRSVEYTYDSLGNVLTMVTPNGTIAYEYGPRQELVAVTDPTGETIRYSYSSSGVLERIAYPGGIVEVRTIDESGLLQNIRTEDGGGAVLSKIVYERDALGRRTAIDRGTDGRTQYEYDARGRLIAETLNKQGEYRRTTYRYDADGNRIGKADSRDGTTSYQYDSRNRLVLESTEQVVKQYSYDANGNLSLIEISGATTGQPTRIEYVWAGERQLSAVRSFENGTLVDEVTYDYDPFGILVRKTVNGLVERYLIDVSSGLSRVLQAYNADGSSRQTNVYGIARAAVIADGQAFYLQTEALETEYGVRNSQGALLAAISFDAFGNPTAADVGIPFDPQYAGHAYDSDTGLYPMRARYMDPTTGRFLSSDMLAGDPKRPASMHRYTYVENDPVSHRDPTGLVSSLAELSTTTKILGGLSAAAIGQGTLGAVLSAVHGTVAWAGNTYSVSQDAFNAGLSIFRSEPVNGKVITADYLTIGLGKSFSLLDFARQKLAKRLDELTDKINKVDRTGLSNQLKQSTRLDRQTLKGEAVWTLKAQTRLDRLQESTASPLPFDIAIGDANLLAPRLFDSYYALAGFYFSAGFNLTAGKQGAYLAPVALTTGIPNAIGASVLIMGFGTGYSVPDTSVTTEFDASVGVSAGVSVPIYVVETPQKK